MLAHVCLIIYFTERNGTAHHLLHQILVESDADPSSEMAVSLPLGGIIPVFGKACRIGGVVEFFLHFIFKECCCFAALFCFSGLIQFICDGFTDAVHKQSHF